MKECPKLSDGVPSCLHCKMNHLTGSRDCEFYKHAHIIESKKRKGSISYNESKSLYAALNNKSYIQLLYPSSSSSSSVKKSTNTLTNKMNSSLPISSNVNLSTNNRFQVLSDSESDFSGDNVHDVNVNDKVNVTNNVKSKYVNSFSKKK